MLLSLSLLAATATLPVAPLVAASTRAQVQVIRGSPKKAKAPVQVDSLPEGKVITVTPDDTDAAHLEAARQAKAANEQELREEAAKDKAREQKDAAAKAKNLERIQKQGEAVQKGFDHLNDKLSGH